MYYDINKPFSDLKDKIITNITGLHIGTDSVVFETKEGISYEMYHRQDCCESVYIDDIVGDVEDLLNTPVLLAEEVENTPDEPKEGTSYYPDSFTWTFYKLSTIKGSITIKWYGTSNGYYSESVTFVEKQN